VEIYLSMAEWTLIVGMIFVFWWTFTLDW
jgi:hypothetical protein